MIIDIILIGLLVVLTIAITCISVKMVRSNDKNSKIIKELKKSLELKELLNKLPNYTKIDPVREEDLINWCKRTYDDPNFQYVMATVQQQLADQMVLEDKDPHEMKHRIRGTLDVIQLIVNIINKTQKKRENDGS